MEIKTKFNINEHIFYIKKTSKRYGETFYGCEYSFEKSTIKSIKIEVNQFSKIDILYVLPFDTIHEKYVFSSLTEAQTYVKNNHL